MARLCALLCLLLLGPVAQADERRAGLLPVEGDAKLAEQLELQLVAALPPGVKLLGVDETRRLHLAEPKVARAIASAAEQLKQADAALVRMQRPAAVAAARAAIVTLESGAARFHSRRALAEAHATLAHALLLRPPDEPNAAACFGRALAADPAYAPDPARTPPRVRAMIEAARRRLTPSAAPRAGALAPLAGVAGARLVWISAHRDSAGVQLELVIYGRAAIERHEHHVTTEAGLVAACAARLALALGPAPAPPSAPPPATTPVAPPAPPPVVVPVIAHPVTPPPAAQPAPPWYKRWWVWTLVGVAVAGTAVGLGVGLTRGNGGGSGGGWDVVFSF